MSRTILPDSRSKSGKGVVQTKTAFGIMVPIYCANCGKPGGLVPEKNMTFAFWVCDYCFEALGEILGTVAQPDQEFWAQVKADQEGERQELVARGDLVLRADGEGDQSKIIAVGDSHSLPGGGS